MIPAFSLIRWCCSSQHLDWIAGLDVGTLQFAIQARLPTNPRPKDTAATRLHNKNIIPVIVQNDNRVTQTQGSQFVRVGSLFVVERMTQCRFEVAAIFFL